MGLSDIVRSAVDIAFTVTEDLQETVVYHKNSTPVFDAAADTMTFTTVDTTFKALFSRFTAAEAKDGVNTLTDAILTFPAASLTYIPIKDDTITVKGLLWSVCKIMTPPSDPIWKIHIREQ